MTDWLVITADAPGAGRGVRGQALVWFLQTYFGRRAVRCLTPKALSRERPRAAHTVLLGLPTSLSAGEIETLFGDLVCVRFALFDYFDQHALAWTAEQEAPLRELANIYLKPWFDPSWGNELKMGLLPVRRYGRFSWALRVDRWLGLLRRRREPLHDVAFVGRPNTTQFWRDGGAQPVEQRVEWILDVKRNAPDLKFWGGLVEANQSRRRTLAERYGDVDDLFYHEEKVDFATYYRNICRSRVLLAPGGNVPWTYRHYECLYAGAAVATIDFRQRDMLVPMPRDNMVHVPDGDSVLPAVREALKMYEERPSLGAENRSHLERFLKDGAYSRSRKALIERFDAQL